MSSVRWRHAEPRAFETGDFCVLAPRRAAFLCGGFMSTRSPAARLPGVELYDNMSELVVALSKTPAYSAAEPTSRNSILKTTLEKIAAVRDVEWLDCQEYKEMTPLTLEDFYNKVFSELVDVDQAQFVAARRKIDKFAFGVSTHPSQGRRSSPRQAILCGIQSNKRQHQDDDEVASASLGSFQPHGSQGTSETAIDSGSAAVVQNLSKCKKHDGTRTVVHPQELLRNPDVDKITELPEKVLRAIDKLKNVTAPFTYRNDKWVALIDEVFIWMLFVQGSLSFRSTLRNKVFDLVMAALLREENPVLKGRITSVPNALTCQKFGEQLSYRTHPPPTRRTGATMQRYGAVRKSPYTEPLIEHNILVWDGKPPLDLEESSLKEGQPGYAQLSINVPRAGINALPTTALNFNPPASVASSSAAGMASGCPIAPLPMMQHMMQHNSRVGEMPMAMAFGIPMSSGTGGHLIPVPFEHQGAMAQATYPATLSNPTWTQHEAAQGSVEMTSGRPASFCSTVPKVPAAPNKAVKPRAQPSVPPTAATSPPKPEHPICIRAPRDLSAAVKQTLLNILLGKTPKNLHVVPNAEEVQEADLYDLRGPYLVASVFKFQNKFQYWVGKPVAKHCGKLICWYPGTGSRPFETAGIFDQADDVAIAPTFIMMIKREDESTAIPCHGEAAEAAAQEYSAEGCADPQNSQALSKYILAWLKAMFNTKTGEEMSNKKMHDKMTRININDTESTELLTQLTTPT